MKLLTKEVLKRLPALGTTNAQDDPIAQVKFFTPDSNWTWFGIEYDPETRQFYGLVFGFEKELGYFNLDELEQIRGSLGLPIERDLYFTPKPVSQLLDPCRT